jgi:Fe-S cluster assembly protein SufB
MSTDLLTADPIGEINKYDFQTVSKPVFKARKGIDAEIVSQISEMKNEPEWMRDFRLKSFAIFQSKPMPKWGGNIGVNFDEIYYYLKPTEHQGHTWDDVPSEIRDTFDKLGIPEAEKQYLAGVKAQFESVVVYGSLKEDLSKQGVIFTDTDTAVKEHPDLLREYFGTIIPPDDNKFAALNSAVWSGGSFIYVPKGVKIEFPLQAYFRINAENMGQFERTLIIVDEGASVHYVEGCTAPKYSTESLHSAVVEILVKRGARWPWLTATPPWNGSTATSGAG